MALIGQAEPLEEDVAEGRVSITVGRHATNHDRGLRVTVDRAVSVWRQLPSETGAVIYDEEGLQTLIAGDLRLAAALDVLTSEMVAIGSGSIDRRATWRRRRMRRTTEAK